jgi:hypothetical protein
MFFLILNSHKPISSTKIKKFNLIFLSSNLNKQTPLIAT